MSDRTLAVPVQPPRTTDALEQLYQGLDGGIVARCEAIRVGLTVDITARLIEVHDLLVPYGKFKGWCRAVGMDDIAASWAVSYAKAHRRALEGDPGNRVHDYAGDLTSMLSRILRHEHFAELSTPRVTAWAARRFSASPETVDRAYQLIDLLSAWTQDYHVAGIVDGEAEQR